MAGMTRVEVALALGISRPRICAIEKNAFRKLRRLGRVKKLRELARMVTRMRERRQTSMERVMELGERGTL